MAKEQPKLTRKEAKEVVKGALKDARETPVGNLGISTDDAIEAIRRGNEGKR